MTLKCYFSGHAGSRVPRLSAIGYRRFISMNSRTLTKGMW